MGICGSKPATEKEASTKEKKNDEDDPPVGGVEDGAANKQQPTAANDNSPGFTNKKVLQVAEQLSSEEPSALKSEENLVKRQSSRLSVVMMATLNFNDFVKYCESRMADENPKFYLEVEEYEKLFLADPAGAKQKAKYIQENFVADNAEHQINISDAQRKEIMLIREEDFDVLSFDKAKKEVIKSMMDTLLPEYEARKGGNGDVGKRLSKLVAEHSASKKKL